MIGALCGRATGRRMTFKSGHGSIEHETKKTKVGFFSFQDMANNYPAFLHGFFRDSGSFGAQVPCWTKEPLRRHFTKKKNSKSYSHTN